MRKREKQENLIAGAAEVAPPISALEALSRNARYAMLQRFGVDRWEDLMDKLEEKAMSGNVPALRLIMENVLAGSGEQRGSVYMQQAIVGGTNRTTVFISDLRRQIVMLIAEQGPKKTGDIAKLVLVDQPLVAEALDHDWFDKESDGYHITAKAIQEALPSKGD